MPEPHFTVGDDDGFIFKRRLSLFISTAQPLIKTLSLLLFPPSLCTLNDNNNLHTEDRDCVLAA